MALQVFDGFDHYAAAADFLSRSGFLQWQYNTSDDQPSISFVTGRASFGGAAKVTMGTNAVGAQGVRAVWTARNAEAFVGFAQVIPTSPALTGLWIILQDTVAGLPQVSIFFNPANYSVQIYRGGWTYNGGTHSWSNTGTLLYASPNNSWIGDATWQFTEVHAKIDGSAGEVVVRVRGVTIASITGVNTQNTSNAWFDATDFTPAPGPTIVTGAYVEIDDLYYCDTTSGPGVSPYDNFLGDCGTKTLFAVGDNSVQFSPQPNTNANWQNVAETAFDGDATYNYNSTVGNEDLLNVQALPADTLLVLAVQVTGAYRKDDVGPRSVKQPLKSGTTKVYGSTFSLPDNYAYFSDLYVLDPDTSANWTVSAVNAASAGYNVAA